MRQILRLLAILLLAGCAAAEPERQTRLATRAAEPQHAELAWREIYPDVRGDRLVFVVDELDVTSSGWTARVAVTNATGISFEAGKRPTELRYGLMLFATGDLGELEDAASSGALPAVRKAVTIEPRPPAVLRPGATWRATLSAPGSLPDGAHVRAVFGPLRAAGDAPEGIEPIVVWITDHSYKL